MHAVYCAIIFCIFDYLCTYSQYFAQYCVFNDKMFASFIQFMLFLTLLFKVYLFFLYFNTSYTCNFVFCIRIFRINWIIHSLIKIRDNQRK